MNSIPLNNKWVYCRNQQPGYTTIFNNSFAQYIVGAKPRDTDLPGYTAIFNNRFAQYIVGAKPRDTDLPCAGEGVPKGRFFKAIVSLDLPSQPRQIWSGLVAGRQSCARFYYSSAPSCLFAAALVRFSVGREGVLWDVRTFLVYSYLWVVSQPLKYCSTKCGSPSAQPHWQYTARIYILRYSSSAQLYRI